MGMGAIQHAAQAPFIRGGTSKQAALVIAGVMGLASILQCRVRRRRRHFVSARASSNAKINQGVLSDTSKEWTGEGGPLQPASPSKGELLLLDETLPLTPKQLWKLIYDLNFIQHFYHRKSYREIGIGGWQRTDGQACSKTSHYITPVKKNVLGPSEAYTEEEYVCHKRGASGFVVHVQAYTRKVPYGKSFHVELTWTASRISATETRLYVVGAFKPEKRMIGVGSIIRKATNEGLLDTYKLYRQHLLEAIDASNLGASRPTQAQANETASRTSSAVTKEAAEDLVRNGVFVSWAQLLWALFLFCCTIAAVRLALDRESRSNVADAWRAEWQQAAQLLQEKL